MAMSKIILIGAEGMRLLLREACQSENLQVHVFKNPGPSRGNRMPPVKIQHQSITVSFFKNKIKLGCLSFKLLKKSCRIFTR